MSGDTACLLDSILYVSLHGGSHSRRAAQLLDVLKLLEREALRVGDPRLARCCVGLQGYAQGFLLSQL